MSELRAWQKDLFEDVPAPSKQEVSKLAAPIAAAACALLLLILLRPAMLQTGSHKPFETPPTNWAAVMAISAFVGATVYLWS